MCLDFPFFSFRLRLPPFQQPDLNMFWKWLTGISLSFSLSLSRNPRAEFSFSAAVRFVTVGGQSSHVGHFARKE